MRSLHHVYSICVLYTMYKCNMHLWAELQLKLQCDVLGIEEDKSFVRHKWEEQKLNYQNIQVYAIMYVINSYNMAKTERKNYQQMEYTNILDGCNKSNNGYRILHINSLCYIFVELLRGIKHSVYGWID